MQEGLVKSWEAPNRPAGQGKDIPSTQNRPMGQRFCEREVNTRSAKSVTSDALMSEDPTSAEKRRSLSLRCTVTPFHPTTDYDDNIALLPRGTMKCL